MKFSSKDKLIIFSLAWLVAAVGMIFAVLVPLSVRIQSFSSVYLVHAGQLKNLERRVEAFGDAKAEFERIMDQAPLVREQFLHQDNAVDFIEWLEGRSAQMGLYRELRLLKEPAGTEGLLGDSVYEFQITLVGSFENIMRFIITLEHGPYVMDILKVKMDPTKPRQSYRGVDTDKPFIVSSGDVASSLTLRVHATP